MICINSGKFGTHTKDGACAARDAAAIKNTECTDQFAAWINGTLHFQGVELTIAFDHQIDLVVFFIPIIPKKAFLAVVHVSLANFCNNVVFKNGSIDSAVCKNFRGGISG